MRLRCAMCGRITLNPAVFIGVEPVGPTCARKHNLMHLAARKGSAVSPGHKSLTVKRDSKTRDLFDE